MIGFMAQIDKAVRNNSSSQGIVTNDGDMKEA